MSSLQFVARIKNREDAKTLHQEFDKSRFDNSWTDPKYLRPRTDTPKLTVGYGGCFSCIYSVRGAGGYQMFGITPMPIYDPTQTVSYLEEFIVFFRPGDIVRCKPICREEYETAVDQVRASTFEPRIRNVVFSLSEFNADLDGTNARLMESLHAG